MTRSGASASLLAGATGRCRFAVWLGHHASVRTPPTRFVRASVVLRGTKRRRPRERRRALRSRPNGWSWLHRLQELWNMQRGRKEQRGFSPRRRTRPPRCPMVRRDTRRCSVRQARSHYSLRQHRPDRATDGTATGPRGGPCAREPLRTGAVSRVAPKSNTSPTEPALHSRRGRFGGENNGRQRITDTRSQQKISFPAQCEYAQGDATSAAPDDPL